MAYNFFGHGVNKLNRYMEEGGYDGVLCVHPFSAIMLTETLRRYPKAVKTGLVATDYTCSPSVADSRMDFYFIPHASLAQEFISCGVPAEKIVASGIPVKQVFFERGSKSAAKKAFGMEPDARHVLLMCGSMGCGPIEELALDVSSRLPKGAVLTVACGTNERLKGQIWTHLPRTAKQPSNLLMDTSQLMNHVVHRQLCYPLFTQVPIEPFFRLGLDFLFAGSDLRCRTGHG